MDRRKNRSGVLQWTPSPIPESPSSTLTSDDSWEKDNNNNEEEEDDFFREMNEDGIIGLSEALEEWELGNPCGDPCSPEDTVPSGGDKDSSLKSSGDDLQPRPAPTENPEPNGLVSKSTVTSSFSPHLYTSTEEELTAASGIEAEMFPDTETESYCSSSSVGSSLPRLELKLRGSPQPAVAISEQVVLENIPSEGSEKQKAGLPPEALKSRTCSLGGAKNGSPEARGCDRNMKAAGARSKPAGMDELRRALVSHQTPNFSKVEPRIHFPKRGYKPPKGRKSLERTTMSPQPPFVFKSPADIVEEVLFNSDGSSYSSDTNTPTKAPNSTVPPDFRCRQQATTLLQQLQEDYDRLLTKYAEAENTIDRLRLDAKVNLDSEPPKAGHAVPAGLNQKASYPFKMDLFHPHRAVTCSPGRATRQEKLDASSPSNFGQQLSNILFTQSEKFLQQVQTFEDLLKKDKLASLEELKRGVSQLYEGLNSLERGYLLARDEHKLLQQRELETRHFDPERNLESLIFQCGVRMEELKEQMEQIQQEQLKHQEPIQLELIEHQKPIQQEQLEQDQIQQEKIQQQEPIQQELIQQEQIQQKRIQQEVQQHKAVASCRSSPPLTSSSGPSEGEITQTQPQSPSEPSQTDSGSAAELEINSACKRSEEEEDVAEDLMSHYLRSLTRRGKRDEFDPADSLDYCQTMRECFIVPKAASSLPSNSPLKHGGEKEEQKGWRNGNGEVQETFSQSRKVQSDVFSVWRTKTSLPSRCPPSTPPAASSRSRKRLERSTSLSSACSLADGAPEWRSCKVQAGSRRVLSQDRISPETDSGFMGSESSHQIPAAVSLRYHQTATESMSAPQDRSPNRPLSAYQLDAGPGDGIELGLRQRRRSRQRRRTFSPQSFISQRKQARADVRPSDLWTLLHSSTNNAHSASEEQQSVRSAGGSLSSSPPAACHRHGNPPRARSSSQGGGGSPIDAFLTLQAEVNLLKEKLEISQWNEELLSSAKNEKPLGNATISRNFCRRRSSSSPIRSVEFCSDISLERRLVQTFDDIEPETLVSHRTRETRGAAAPKQQQNLFFRGSEPEQLQSQVSRFTPTSLAPHNVSSDVRSRNTQTWMSSALEAADGPDSKDESPLCPQCLSILRQPAERPLGGSREPSDPPCWCRCPICGLLKMHICTDSDCYRYFPSSHINNQPSSSERVPTRRFSAAAVSPSPLNHVPLYSQQLLLPSKTRYSSPDMSPGRSSGVRRPRERKSRRRRSHSVEGQASLDGSLERAIRAARRMKHTSGHMARSLASGLVSHKLLTQSCYY
ncbi:AT-hook-containing transcription factor isoform X2 [Xiphophorus maculatus]|uniref:AT-hook-containing transcription factor isoform X2 n=1 Tax=Xiphophorus maculatus TaxID=8083 RepID=UPI000C6CB624|nr:AT-hook-containing transcription factor isoform X2 [Xiphophorus maculatus]